MKRNISQDIDKEEASYDYLVGIAQREKNKRREKFQRKQTEHKMKRMRRDSKRFAGRIDEEYDEY